MLRNPVVRLAVDTGGTFTDLVTEDAAGKVALHKSSTTPDDPARGVFDVLEAAAAEREQSLADLLAEPELFIHGTTRATNAIITGNTARTALLTTRGHRDVLLYREGLRPNPFDNAVPYPEPYVPRQLTFEVEERIDSRGAVLQELDEVSLRSTLERLGELEVEAISVCLLWSIVNPAHELRVGKLIEEVLPGRPLTLSHRLNPILREYRRASSTAIDASLKPLMTSYMESLEARLREAGFGGRLLVVSSNGGALDAAKVAAAPIHSINSGPAMAPVAGRAYAELELGMDTAVVADAGGTTYDVSLVRGGRIPRTKETWLGADILGHITGFPAVDVKSVGAGGGSIAYVDSGGLLHVGPQSAGAAPGPACYGQGGDAATVTDACLALGYIDPHYFLGGSMELDPEAARRVLSRDVAEPLGISLDEAASSVLRLATEHMVRIIETITVDQGIDPRTAVLVGGGGAAGLNAVAIARRLEAPKVVLPAVGAALSAAGGLLSDLSYERAATLPTTNQSFAYEAVNELLAEFEAECREFLSGPGASAIDSSTELIAEARYPKQTWDIEVILDRHRFDGPDDVEHLRQAFHDAHEGLFAYADRESPIEIVGWRTRLSCRLRDAVSAGAPGDRGERKASTRVAYFEGIGRLEAPVHELGGISPGARVRGPAIIESPFTTIVLDDQAEAVRTASGGLVVDPTSERATGESDRYVGSSNGREQ